MVSQLHDAPTPTSNKELQVRTVLHKIKRGKANWLGYILRRNFILIQFIARTIEGRIEVKGRRGRRSKQLLNYLGKEGVLEADRGSTRSHCVEN